ncbi:MULTISPECIES: pyridoxamine 5'-phosphate oxidase family protein [Streptosporangium]|uniref:Nitroimidazol reductase NimA-like FMN-containing flavoprotein (Pyridoxamine 5'-phosphate oxidase superfamily) n=1 Tax=Streptosporangium brasiliense TaxID=47480 RepID=A0ABT9RF15_9ACTN|nr:pyridoxamine 5'-phosphate oxidase family protein [Streptosporangium brasiliense]MDP9867857.1 nitroimidazol reductase NimA-like FMN-containing flavoprotein (pyridoxamine 5'-phosphate oxidase superfamily) [Streptosporangium brasiliense]
MRPDTAGAHVLSREECIGLLASAPIGRIVFTDRALPAVQPVGFCLDGEDIVIRAVEGSAVAATRDAVVAFEADDFDSRTRTGWSVTAVGYARAVSDPVEIARLSALPLTTWVPGGGTLFIKIPAELVAGRCIRH